MTTDSHDLQIRIQMTLEEILMAVKHLTAALGASSDSRSSVEIKTSTRGVDITSKAYDGSNVEAQVGPAVQAYFTAIQSVQARLNGQTT